MDVEIIINAFIVVVIGGLGSFWGTFLGSLIVGQVYALGILAFPKLSLAFIYVLMALVLILRPWGLLGRRLQR
jgi:branched-subunit amino acid ABC-type transport system permease component